MAMDTLLIATHNKGKVVEFDKMLSGLDITLKSAADFDLPEPEETEDSFIGNALLKAHAAVTATGVTSLADDSGIAIDALNGAPGIYSARWAETPSNNQEGRDFNMAMERVNVEISKLNDRGIDGTQTAYFVAVLALVYPNGEEVTFEGRMNGTLCWPPRGEKGFGYDPIFVPNGLDKTFAEIDPAEKHAMSHRAIAVDKFKQYLIENA